MRTKELYFVNFWVDLLCIGGLSTLVFGALTLLPSASLAPSVIVFAAALTWFINDPHFAATNYRLYGDKRNFSQFPVTAFLIPILILAMTVAAFVYPLLVAPMLVKMYVIWSPYHFSGQSVGISKVYLGRARIKLTSRESTALSGFLFASFTTVLLYFETGTSMNDSFFGIPYPTFGIPTWVPYISAVFMVICGLYFFGSLLRRKFKLKEAVPLIVVVPAITHFCWFIGGFYTAVFDELVPLFHSAQYLFIAFAVHIKTRMDKDQKESVPATYFFKHGFKWWGANIAGGLLMFHSIPYLVGLFPIVFSGLGTPLFAAGIISAAVQLHHFFVDGVIWKLKNQGNQHPLKAHLPSLINNNERITSSPSLAHTTARTAQGGLQ